MFQGGFDDNFSGYPENWLSASRRWDVENNENSQHVEGRRLGLPQTMRNVWNRLRFLKKHFIFLEELNRRIRENGINLRLSCIYLFQNIFPAAWSLPQNTASFAFFPDFSHLFSDSDHFFRDPWVPLTFFPAATLVVYHIPIKIREKNNVLTQHSVNAHTKPLSGKQSLSESCGGSYQTWTIFRICAQRYWNQSLQECKKYGMYHSVSTGILVIIDTVIIS